jgi:hypothetical protein
MIAAPNQYGIRAGDVWLRRQGADVYLRDVPDGETVIEIAWGCPENCVFLTVEDIEILARLAQSLKVGGA